MQSMTFGQVPADLEIGEPYEMTLNPSDLRTVAAIVNQGIDSHLEAVFTEQKRNQVRIMDSASMRCFLRRCMESDDDNAQDLASSIITTLGYEWI